ncbi:MAG TPA: Ku protein [Capillimicrobium sp.]|jgi:DNA end-binding protein Ku
MARSLWSGTLSFGLVNVPVQLFSAVRDQDLHFHQLHEKDGAPIETRRFCSKEDEEVEWEEIAHGFETDAGEQVIVTDDDLAAVAPRKTKTIDISAFVDLADVDPIYFDHPYFLVPAGEAEGARRAYRLLVEAMGGSDRAALGRFVLRTKEYLVLVRVRDGLLSLTTMRFHDEVRPTKGIDTGGKKPASKQLDQAVKLIESLSSDWDPSRYRDEYRKRLQSVVKRKKQGKTITVPTDEEVPAPAADLMAALEKSLAEVRGAAKGKAKAKAKA